MTRFRKRKKIFRKFIKRLKNRFQRVRKFCRMHTLPVLVAVGIMVSVIFASYQNAYATGLEEYFYYTYFDLISGLFSETGAHFGLKDDYYTKSDRVSGKQVWDNFCTWVENKAKVAALPVEVVNKTVFDELKNLPNTVTSAGANMSSQLSELLAKILPTFNDSGSGCVFSSAADLKSYLETVVGAPAGYYGGTQFDRILKGEEKLYILQWLPSNGSQGYYEIFGLPSGYTFDSFNWSYFGTTLNVTTAVGTSSTYRFSPLEVAYVGTENVRSWDYSDMSWTFRDYYKDYGYRFLVQAGEYCEVQNYAKVKTVDDNTVYVPGVGYKTNWDIWKDIVNDKATTDTEEEAWNSRYNFDNDNKDDKEKKKKDNEKDKLPVVIPIVFPNKKPDSTEKDSEKDSEKDTTKPGGGGKPGSSENPTETEKDTEKDTEEKATDSGQLPGIAEKVGNWKRLFPFCIPWDMISLVKSMKADKKAPVFEFKYTFKAVNYTWKITVDMSDYWKYIKIFRWGMTIFFIIGLFFLTVKFTTFVYKMGG